MKAFVTGIGGHDVRAAAGVEGAQDADRVEHLGGTDGHLGTLKGGARQVGSEVSGSGEGENGAMGSDDGAGTAAVAVLYGSDDEAAAGELADIGRVIGAGRGHAVGEDDDGETVAIGGE